ncbi:SH3-like domain-containing protein [Amycolatopsis sp. NPDC004368]
MAGEELDAATQRFREQPQAELPQAQADEVDDQVLDYLRRGDTPRRGPATPAFAVGDEVVVKNPPATDHTRLPGYLRGHRGRVERVFEGNYSYFVSTGGDGLGEPMAVYIVRFEPGELWGEETERAAGPLYAELYETYLTRDGNR